MATIKKCICIHPFQDERYGFQKRVHNTCKDGKHRCTVCLDVKRVGASSTTDAKEEGADG